MGFTLNTQRSLTVGGKTIQSQENVTDDLLVGRDTNVVKAQPATVTSGGGTIAGSLTMTNGSHGIATANKVDLYWVGGFRAGCVVGTVAGTTVPVTGGVGAVLPPNTTKITVCLSSSLNFPAIGANIQGLALGIDDVVTECTFVFYAADGTTVLWTRHIAANQGGDFWSVLSAWANPLAGVTSATVRCSHADTLRTHAMQAVAVTH